MKAACDLPYAYRAYGYNLVSDIPLVRLMPGTDPALATITVQRSDAAPDHPATAKQVFSGLWGAPNYLSLDIEGVVHLSALNGEVLHYHPYKGADDTTVQLFLMGSGLGALLMQRKLLVMHGNAAKIDDACVMCVGPSGIGKSTTAAGLLQRGFEIMSNDICAIDARNCIVPGMPHIKLWQDAADGLGVSTSHLKKVSPELEKYGVPLNSAFCEDVVPVKAIYLLSRHDAQTVEFETLTGQHKFMALRENTYRLPFVKSMGLETLHFQQLNSLANTTVVKRIKRPQEGFEIDRLLDALLSDVRTRDCG